MGRSRRRRHFAATVWASGSLLLLACAGAPRTSSFQFLHVVPTRVDPDRDPNGPLLVAVDVAKPAALTGALVPDAVLASSDREVVVRLLPYPARAAEQQPLHLESSFLVDFDSESVRGLIAARSKQERPTPSELVGWTRDAIEPSSDRGFDAASVIARSGRGDCTEHAVLFSALARSFGYPTRIALGLVIVESEHALQAYGHAWTEVRSEGIWQPVDPTDIEGADAIAYLPVGYLADEGPGYGLELLRLTTAAGISGVRVLGKR